MKIKNKIEHAQKFHYYTAIFLIILAGIGFAMHKYYVYFQEPIYIVPQVFVPRKVKEAKPAPGKPLTIEEQMRKIADSVNFKWTDYLIKLAKCESNLKPECLIINHEKCINPTNKSFDRGLFQISRKWHPEVADEQAFNLEYATKWTMGMIEKGQQAQWSCDKIVLAQK